MIWPWLGSTWEAWCGVGYERHAWIGAVVHKPKWPLRFPMYRPDIGKRLQRTIVSANGAQCEKETRIHGKDVQEHLSGTTVMHQLSVSKSVSVALLAMG